MKEIYLAGGCFWGLERFLSLINGVKATSVGYANGKTINPTYQDVCNESGHSETVKVIYDNEVLSLDLLLKTFFLAIDPIAINKQGNDIGIQYRTGIYYTNEYDIKVISDDLLNLQKSYTEKIAIEVLPLEHFYEAEEYHQNYLVKHPSGYCHIGPNLFDLAKKANPRFKVKTNNELKAILTPLQYAVTKENGTERPFDNEYDNEFRKGIYVDITTLEPLFVSSDKYDSGCGWPAFTKPISRSLIKEKIDKTHNMIRTEVRSENSDIHLGHVFTDGPKELGGLRYCINSAALKFIPIEMMEEKGYKDYIELIK